MRKCSAPGCDLKHSSLGYCRKHHARLIRNGSIDSKYDMDCHDQRKEERIDHVKDDRPGARGYLAINIINDIKFKARQRGKIWNLSHSEAFKLITASCAYCGIMAEWPKTRMGIDRFDNLGDYTPENCVSCCAFCNNSKHNKTGQELLNWIQKTNLKK